MSCSGKDIENYLIKGFYHTLDIKEIVIPLEQFNDSVILPTYDMTGVPDNCFYDFISER